MNTSHAVIPGRPARLSCRVDARIKQRAEEAAALLGQSITVFTETALAEKADEVFERHDKIQLSGRDFEQFVIAIDAAVPPTAELKAAMKEYERQRAEEAGGNW